MYGNIHKRLLGVVFIGLLVLGVWFVNAIFTQKFTDFEKVTLQTDTVGLNLPAKADIKVRGLIVGQVLEADTNTGSATLTLGIKPEHIKSIPSNVTASLIPKTLFGEKYVSLDIPKSGAASSSLQAGDDIKETKLPVELEQVLNDLFPLLRSVQPAEVKYTLDALATALEGRGDDIGENLEVLDRYLTRLNPQVPKMMEDLRLLSTVANNYADVMPQIADTLRNTITTGGTLVAKEAQLKRFLNETTRFSNVTEGFLEANGRNIVRLGNLSAKQLALLERYSPEFPCFFKGMVRLLPRGASTFRGQMLHISLNTIDKQPRAYRREDLPVLGVDGGPNCVGLPNPPVPLLGAPNFNDGVNNQPGDSPLGRNDAQRALPGFDTEPAIAGDGGTAVSKALVAALASPILGVPVDEVPDIASLLFTPLMTGTEVSMR